jgi:hypothetical protein
VHGIPGWHGRRPATTGCAASMPSSAVCIFRRIVTASQSSSGRHFVGGQLWHCCPGCPIAGAVGSRVGHDRRSSCVVSAVRPGAGDLFVGLAGPVKLRPWFSMASRPPRRSRRATYRDGVDAAQRFEGGLQAILSISKKELNRREDEYQKSRAHKDRPGPRPRRSRNK